MAGKARNSVSRMSLATVGRPTISRRSSSMSYGKGSQPRADPRPVNDKAFQVASMRKIVEYLTTHGYNFPISPKLLPSGKDIHNMIEFLFRQVDPSYRLIKLEDDVPAFFRMIGYPCQISKSALYAAGSPHSWPNLLAALAWLVDLLNCEEKEAEIKAEGETNPEMLFEYLSQSYSSFLEGDDAACSELEKQMEQQTAEATEEARMMSEEIARQITDLDAKLQALKTEQSPVLVLETKKAQLIHDVGKFNSLIQNLNTHMASLEKRLEQHKQLMELKKAELVRCTAENENLAERVSSQTVDVEGFEKMTRDMQRTEEELQSTSASRKEKEKETWDLEVLASKRLKKLESIALDCNHAIRRLKVSTPDTSSTAGNSFEINLNPRGETPLDLLGVDIKQFIRPRLAALLEECEKVSRDKWKESTDLLKEIHVKEDAMQEEKAANSQLETKREKLESLHKKVHAKLEAIQSSAEEVRMQSEEDEEKLKALELESTERLERVKQEIEELEAVFEQEIQQKASRLYAVLVAVVDHVEQIQSGNAKLKSDVDQLEEQVKTNFVRTHKHREQMLLNNQRSQ